MTPSYLNAMRTGMFGPPPAPMPGASTAAPIAAGVPQPSAANPNIASMFAPVLGGSVMPLGSSAMNPLLAGGPSNAALAAANPVPPNPYAGLAQRGWGGAPIAPGISSMSGIPGVPGGSQNAAIAAAQNPMLSQAFRNQFGSLLGGRGMGWGGVPVGPGMSAMSGISGIPGGSQNAAIATAQAPAAMQAYQGMMNRFAPVLAGRQYGML